MMFIYYLASSPEDQEEDGHEKEDGTSVTSAPAGSVGSSTPIKCPLGFKACKDDSECVLYKHVCDGEADCTDGSDEEECSLECEGGKLCVLLYIGEGWECAAL